MTDESEESLQRRAHEYMLEEAEAMHEIARMSVVSELMFILGKLHETIEKNNEYELQQLDYTTPTLDPNPKAFLGYTIPGTFAEEPSSIFIGKSHEEDPDDADYLIYITPIDHQSGTPWRTFTVSSPHIIYMADQVEYELLNQAGDEETDAFLFNELTESINEMIENGI